MMGSTATWHSCATKVYTTLFSSSLICSMGVFVALQLQGRFTLTRNQDRWGIDLAAGLTCGGGKIFRDIIWIYIETTVGLKPSPVYEAADDCG
jgi:hypothetical protein